MTDIFTVGNVTVLINILNLVVITVTAFLVYRQIKSNHDWNLRKTAHGFIIELNPLFWIEIDPIVEKWSKRIEKVKKEKEIMIFKGKKKKGGTDEKNISKEGDSYGKRH